MIKTHMIISYRITPESFAAFYQFTSKKVSQTRSGPQSFFTNMFLWFLLTVGFMFLLQFMSRGDSTLHWPSVATGAFPLMVFLIVYISKLLKNQRQLMPPENGFMLGNRTLEITEQGINETGHNYQTFYYWQVIQEVTNNEGDYYLYVDKVAAMIIPAIAFNGPSEADTFIGLVQQNIEDHQTVSSQS